MIPIILQPLNTSIDRSFLIWSIAASSILSVNIFTSWFSIVFMAFLFGKNKDNKGMYQNMTQAHLGMTIYLDLRNFLIQPFSIPGSS